MSMAARSSSSWRSSTVRLTWRADNVALGTSSQYADALTSGLRRPTLGTLDRQERHMPLMTKYEPGTPSWGDLGSPRPEAASRFYSDLFGWTVTEGPPDAGGYRMCLL